MAVFAVQVIDFQKFGISSWDYQPKSMTDEKGFNSFMPFG